MYPLIPILVPVLFFSPNASKTYESESRVNGKILSSKYLAIKINNIKKINMKLDLCF